VRAALPVNQFAKVLIRSEQDYPFRVRACQDRVIRRARCVFGDLGNFVAVGPQPGDHRPIHALVGEQSHAERRSSGTINSLRSTAAA
jgi:hypothetical protein